MRYMSEEYLIYANFFEGLIMQIKITVDVGNFLEIFYWPSKYVEKKSVLVLVCVSLS